MKVIGIAGGSASGKSTLARKLANVLNAVVISHDDYYRESLPVGVTSWDDPRALETSLLCEHLDVLAAGGEVTLPRYDFATGQRLVGATVGPVTAVIIEGLFVLADADLRTRLTASIFVDAPDALRLARRIERDTQERGRSEDKVRARWARDVQPGYEAHVAPSKTFASLTVSSVGETVHEVLEHLCD
jgi:uridine kinase